MASPVRKSPQFVSRANYRGTRFHKPTEPFMSAKVVENSSISGLDVCIPKIQFLSRCVAHQVLGFKTQGHFDGFSETSTPTRVTRFRKGISLNLIQSLVITLT